MAPERDLLIPDGHDKSFPYRRMVRVLFILFLLLFTVHPALMQEGDVTHLVLAIDGTAQIVLVTGQGAYTAPQPLTVGARVRSGDVILTNGGQVSILCANNVVITMDAPQSSPTCSDENPDLDTSYGGVTIYRSSTRGGNVAYTLTPRNTLLWEKMPVLSWTAYKPLPSESGADITYKVELINTNDQSVMWSQDGLKTTRIDFPSADPLDANDPAGNNLVYEVRVTAVVDGLEQSSIDPFAPFGFCVIDPRDREALTPKLEEVENINNTLPDWVSDEARDYRLALFYYNHELYYDALQILTAMLPVPLDEPFPAEEIAPNKLTSSPAYYVLLANTYYSMRLPNEMNAAYERGVELATQLNDGVSLAWIAEQRAEIARAGLPVVDKDDDPEIYELYDAAIAQYEAIGDTAKAGAVRERRDAELEPSPLDKGPCARSL